MPPLLRLLPLLVGLLLARPSYAQRPAGAAAVMQLPFDVVGGVLVLRNLTFNGRHGDFILDTGCAYALVVEQAAFPGRLRPSATQGLSAAGVVPLYDVQVTQFAWGTAALPPTVQATSLAALRAVVGPRLLGLLGSGLLRHYELVLDFAHHRLSCYPLGASPARARPFTRRDSVAFTLETGWPIAIAYVDSVPVQLLLDTGAAGNQLEADFAHNLPAGFRPTGGRREALLAPGGHSVAQRATLPTLQVGTTTWRDVPVLLAPSVRYQSGRALPYQGVLGNVFFSQKPLVSFHYGRRRFYVLTPARP